MSIEAHKLIAENKLLSEVIDLRKELTAAKVKAGTAVMLKTRAQRQRDLVRMQLIATKRELAEKKKIVSALEKENLKLRRSLLEASL